MDAQKKQALIRKLTGKSSCAGCAYLYREQYGYSSYTIVGDYIHCALDRNPHLKDQSIEPPDYWDWTGTDPDNDKFSATRDSMCERYIGPIFQLANLKINDDPEDQDKNDIDNLSRVGSDVWKTIKLHNSRN